jgi:AcrR family transcriptional regulator
VVDVAIDVADAQGWESLTLAAIAAELGVSVPSLYKHVDGLAGVRRLVTLRAVGELAEVVMTSVVGRAGSDALSPLCHGYRDYAVRHPGRYAATVVAPAADDEAHQAASDRVLMPVLAVLGGYGIPEGRRVDAARLLRATLHGFVTLELGGGFGLPDDVSASFDSAVRALDAALSDWPS